MSPKEFAFGRLPVWQPPLHAVRQHAYDCQGDLFRNGSLCFRRELLMRIPRNRDEDLLIGRSLKSLFRFLENAMPLHFRLTERRTPSLLGEILSNFDSQAYISKQD